MPSWSTFCKITPDYQLLFWPLPRLKSESTKSAAFVASVSTTSSSSSPFHLRETGDAMRKVRPRPLSLPLTGLPEPRHVFCPSYFRLELHGLSDASQLGYGAHPFDSRLESVYSAPPCRKIKSRTNQHQNHSSLGAVCRSAFIKTVVFFWKT